MAVVSSKNLLRYWYLPKAPFHRFFDKKELSEGNGVFLLYETSSGQVKDKFVDNLKIDNIFKTKNLGTIHHDSILGSNPNDYVISSTGRRFLLQKPTLGRYLNHLSRASWIPNTMVLAFNFVPIDLYLFYYKIFLY